MRTAAEVLEDEGVGDAFAEVNGVRLHYVHAGKGPLVVLLHGFPEFWYSWRFQIPALARAGFRVVAPDMRGYNRSSRPAGWRAYDVERLADDVAALIDHLGAERAHVVGHDWGAGVAYTLATSHPRSVERLAILNVPHPGRLLRGLITLRQLRKSWYFFFFQLPWLPEHVITREDFRFPRKYFLGSASPGTFDAGDLERYREAWSQPGAPTAMVNYYRGMLRKSPRAVKALMRPIEAPTLVIWGEGDRYLGKELAQPEARWVPNARVERLPGASHWVQHEEPERVNDLLVDFLAARSE